MQPAGSEEADGGMCRLARQRVSAVELAARNHLLVHLITIEGRSINGLRLGKRLFSGEVKFSRSFTFDCSVRAFRLSALSNIVTAFGRSSISSQVCFVHFRRPHTPNNNPSEHSQLVTRPQLKATLNECQRASQISAGHLLALPGP